MLVGLYKNQIGKETVLGTEVDATTYLRAKGFWNDETEILFPDEDVGIASGIGRSYISNYAATLQYDEMPLTYEQVGYFLNMGIKGVAGVQDGAGTDYIYTYALPYNAAVAPYYYTIEAGDEIKEYIFTGAFVEELTIKGEFGGPLMVQPTIRCIPKGQTTFKTGLSIPAVTEAQFGLTKLYIDTVAAGFAGTAAKTSTFQSFELTMSQVQMIRPVSNGTGRYYVATKMGAGFGEITLKITLEHDALSVAEDTARLARTPRAIQIIAAHDTAVATPGTTYTYKSLIMNICGTYSNTMELSETDGNVLATHTLKSHYDATLDSRGSIVLVTEAAALA